MTNEQLRRALDDAGLTYDRVAEELVVDAKTVQRWVTTGRVPHARHRRRLVSLLGRSEAELWPPPARPLPEMAALYPQRAAVPGEVWWRLLDGACEHIDVLAWAATFFHQQPRIAPRLANAAARGARVRLCFGDPTASAVAVREREEPVLGPGVLAGKIRVTLGYYRDLVDLDGIEVRLHDAVVYASLFRYDDEMIVNPHVYGDPASSNPALHLRTGPIFEAYAASFDTVWADATPWKGEQV